jgi:hypothetical protein
VLRRLTMTELLAACRDVTGGDATPVWAGDRRLLDHGLEPWEDLPFWLPDKSPASAKSTRPPPRRPACTFAR